MHGTIQTPTRKLVQQRWCVCLPTLSGRPSILVMGLDRTIHKHCDLVSGTAGCTFGFCFMVCLRRRCMHSILQGWIVPWCTGRGCNTCFVFAVKSGVPLLQSSCRLSAAFSVIHLVGPVAGPLTTDLCICVFELTCHLAIGRLFRFVLGQVLHVTSMC